MSAAHACTHYHQEVTEMNIPNMGTAPGGHPTPLLIQSAHQADKNPHHCSAQDRQKRPYVPSPRAPMSDQRDRRIAAVVDEPTDLLRRRRAVLESLLAERRDIERGRPVSAYTERLVDYLAAHRLELRRRRQGSLVREVAE